MTTPKKPFAYTETQCVLEYLDPNFRYLLASRCPDLRTAHHNTPQRIKRLVLHDRLPQVTVNKAEHHVEYRVSGRVRKENEKRAIFLELIPGTLSRFWLPGNYSLGDSVKILFRNFFVTNQSISIDHLEIKVSRIDQAMEVVQSLPAGAQFRIRELQIGSHVDQILPAILPFLHPSSFPLQKLMIGLENEDGAVFQQEAVQTARFLDIADGNVGIEPEVEIGWYRRLGELPNQRIHFSSPVRTVNEYNLFYRSLILEPREIGFKFTQIVVRGNIIEMLRELLREFNPPENRFFNENACITFQLDNQKELNIYCNGDSPYSEELTLTMEVMKAGSTSEGSI